MAAWRDIQSKMLANVHSHFTVPAVYLTHIEGIPQAVAVRDHTTHTRLENDDTWGDSPGYLTLAPTLIFATSELSKVLQNAYVVMSATEVYLTGASRPPKDGYIAVDVTEATGKDITKLMDGLDMGNLDAAWGGILP